MIKKQEQKVRGSRRSLEHPWHLLSSVYQQCQRDTESLARRLREIKSNWELWSIPNSMLNLFQAPKIIFNMCRYSVYFLPQMPGQIFPTKTLMIIFFLPSNVKEHWPFTDNWSFLWLPEGTQFNSWANTTWPCNDHSAHDLTFPYISDKRNNQQQIILPTSQKNFPCQLLSDPPKHSYFLSLYFILFKASKTIKSHLSVNMLAGLLPPEFKCLVPTISQHLEQCLAHTYMYNKRLWMDYHYCHTSARTFLQTPLKWLAIS